MKIVRITARPHVPPEDRLTVLDLAMAQQDVRRATRTQFWANRLLDEIDRLRQAQAQHDRDCPACAWQFSREEE